MTAAKRSLGLTRAVVLAALTASTALAAIVLVAGLLPGSSPAARRFAAPGISFEVPSSWTIASNDLPLHYEHVLAYVGTGAGKMACGTDYVAGLGGTCQESIVLAPDTIVVKVSSWDGPPGRASSPSFGGLPDQPGASPTTVAGLPAEVRDIPSAPYGADRAIEWTFSRPGVELGSFVLTAYIRGPHTSPLVASLDALISTIELS